MCQNTISNATHSVCMSRPITPNELSRIFPNATKSTIKSNNTSDHDVIACAKLQKRQDDHTGKADHKTRKTSMDGEVHPKFHATITLFVSDNRRRDGDGAESTILDCIVHSFRRLSSMPDGMLLELYRSSKGRRGSDN